MPCNTVTSITLELKNANLELLKKALESLDYKVDQKDRYLSWQTGDYNGYTGEFQVRYEEVGYKIKRAYTSQLVQYQAKRFGWKIKALSDNKFQIQKG